MKKVFSKIFCLLLVFAITSAAYSQNCESNLQRATELVSQKKYCDAKKYYQAYANCNAEADVSTEIAICERFCKTQGGETGNGNTTNSNTDYAAIHDEPDIITLNDGSEINAKVSEIGAGEIKYTRLGTTLPTYTLQKSNIFMIKYANGSEDVFNETAEPNVSTQINPVDTNYSEDDELSWNTPSVNERKTEYQDGVPYQYYVNNGLTISLTNTKNNDYGKWFRADIVIQNNTPETIDFDPASSITAYSVDKNNKQTNLGVWSYEKYMKKVHSAEIWNAVAVGLAGGLAAASAGYTTSTTTTNTHYNGIHNNNHNSVPVRGSGNYSHNSGMHTTRTTTTYDAAAAYRASVIAQDNMAALSDSQWNINNAIQMGYLKRNTIYSGQSIAGYVLIQRKSGIIVNITITINGADYEYSWNY